MANTGTSKKAESSFITKAEITSNKDKNKVVSLLGGTLAPGPRLEKLMYYESILQDTVKAEIVFDDTGGAVDNKSAIEGLPIVGTEEVNLAFEDNGNNKIKVKLYVNKVTPVYEDTRKKRVQLNMVSEEFIKNEEADARVRSRFDGRISDHIEKILKSDQKHLFLVRIVRKDQVQDSFSLKPQRDSSSNLLMDCLHKKKRNHFSSMKPVIKMVKSQQDTVVRFFSIKQITISMSKKSFKWVHTGQD
jgi:hypothetical protein